VLLTLPEIALDTMAKLAHVAASGQTGWALRPLKREQTVNMSPASHFHSGAL
jgi:hypothetical protein